VIITSNEKDELKQLLDKLSVDQLKELTKLVKVLLEKEHIEKELLKTVK
jgi:hypothetical protein